MRARDILVSHDGAEVCAWIVDLRDNRGGNICQWWMRFFLFSCETEQQSVVGRQGGRSVQGPVEGLPPLEEIVLQNADKPLAVLISGETASSGEGVAIAFKGLPNVRFFGEQANYLVSVNNQVRLPDRAQITMTVGYSRDRTGKLWTGPVQPDEEVPAHLALDAARKWLHRSC